jgi:hypothetical protein
MDAGRLTQGQKIAGIAGLILLISLWFSWYGVDLGSVAAGIGIDADVNAWGAFGFTDIVLFVTAIAALAYAGTAAMGRPWPVPVAPSLLVLGLGALATLLILYRIINQPGPNDVIELRFGAFVGLLAAAGVALAGVRSMGDEPAPTASTSSATADPAPATPPPAAAAPPNVEPPRP